MKHTTSADNPLVGRVGKGLHPQRQVLLQFFLQAVVDVAAGDILSLLAEERRIVDGKEHAHGGLVDGNGRQRLGILKVADGVAYLKFLQTDDGTDVATVHLLSAHMGHALKSVQLLDACLLHLSIAVHDGDVHAFGKRSTVHPAHGNTAGIAGVVETGDEHLWRTFNRSWCRYHLHYLVKQIGDVGCRCLVVFAHPSILGTAIHHGEVQLVFGGIERKHQVEHHLIHFLRTAVGFIHLVHHHDGFQANLQGFLKHEAGLRHGAFEGIHQEQTAVGHVEHTLYLAAEVGVSRSVDDIDFRTFPVDGNVF